MRQLKGHKGTVRSLAFHPDGGMLASGGVDGTARLWDLGNNKNDNLREGREDPVNAVTFSPDGKTVAWGDASGVVLCKVASRTGRLSLPVQNGAVNQVFFSLDGSLLGASCQRLQGSVYHPAGFHCWETAWGDEKSDLWAHFVDWDRQRIAEGIGHAALVPDARTLTPHMLQHFRSRPDTPLVDWGSGPQKLALFRRPDEKYLFAPDSSVLVRFGRSQLILVCPLTAPRSYREIRGHKRHVKCGAFSPAGTCLATGGLDGTVIFWELGSWHQLAHYDWQVGPVHALAFAPDGMTAAVGGEKGIVIFDVDLP
jgi:WD40 repeat protein